MAGSRQPIAGTAVAGKAPLRLRLWRDPPVMGVALVMVAAGFAQFGPAAVLADVAEHFGNVRAGGTVAEQAGLSGTVLGAGLGAIRLSALAALPLAALADTRGRRATLLLWVSLGLVATAVAAASPGYWWFVVALAVARPFLTATNTISEAMAAELTATADRAKAIALVSAAYALGAGAVPVLRGLLGDHLGFRGVFALAGVLLVLVAVASRWVTETERFRAGAGGGGGGGLVPVLRAVRRPHRRPLVVVGGITFGAGLITGPATTLLYVYAENLLDLSRAVTGALVVAAGFTGLAGLLLGRFLSDHLGRRPTGALALGLLAAVETFTYSGTVPALVVGYPLGVFAAAVFGTPVLALGAELFPTAIRAAVGGWLVIAGVVGATSGLLIVGALADVWDSFTAAMAAACIPGGLAAILLALVPETRGKELEQSAPDSGT